NTCKTRLRGLGPSPRRRTSPLVARDFSRREAAVHLLDAPLMEPLAEPAAERFALSLVELTSRRRRWRCDQRYGAGPPGIRLVLVSGCFFGGIGFRHGFLLSSGASP